MCWERYAMVSVLLWGIKSNSRTWKCENSQNISSRNCMLVQFNKHSESIAKAIQVPYRPQHIFKRNNSYNSRSKGPKSNFKLIKSKYHRGKFGKTSFLQRALTPVKEGQAWRNSNLSCIESKAIHIQNFNWISQKTAEKSLENLIWAKGSNSCKIRPSVTKLELELYYVMTNSYTKFQVNI